MSRDDEGDSPKEILFDTVYNAIMAYERGMQGEEWAMEMVRAAALAYHAREYHESARPRRLPDGAP